MHGLKRWTRWPAQTRHAPGYDRVPWEKTISTGTIEFWYNELDQSLEHMKKVTAARR